jgi:Tol biopolymer transport system component
MLATLCALAGVLTFTSAAAQAVNAAGFAPEPCPNEQLRTEQPFGLLLPDCRAYEQVSPVDKNGYAIVPPAGGGFTEDLARASVSGEAITYVSFGSFADPAAAMYVSRYVSRRGAGGWSTQNITPPYSSYLTSVEGPYWSLVFTPELSMGVVETNGGAVGARCENLYLADIASSSYQQMTNCGNAPEVQGASTDLSHIVFTPERGGVLYEWVGGQLSKVDVANDGTSIKAQVGGMPGSIGSSHSIMKNDRWHAVSDDGLRIFFTDVEEGTADYEQLYVRENPEQLQSALGLQGECIESGKACTVEVSASQRTIADSHGPQLAEYLGASVDGSKVFFDSRAELTNNANTGGADNAANLYEYDLKSGVLTDLTVDTNAGDLEGAAVLGMVTAGEDGSYVYYVADGVLASGAAPGNCAAKPNASPVGATCNLYVQHYNGTEWTPPVFIATLAAGDAEDWLKGSQIEGGGIGGPANNTARITPDGTHLAFLSEKSLTGYDNQPAEPADCEPYAGAGSIPCSEVFSFDATQPLSPENPVCVSCNPSGARPVGPSRLSEINNASDPFYYTPRNFSEDGSRLFFDSRDALVPHASNGRQNVYEHEGGHVHLISNGAGSYDSSFLDASPSGDDVFIATADRLVPQDQDSQVDVYDAKVGGGFPVSVSPPACDNGDSCKGPVSPQPSVFGAPASATFSGAGNLAPVAVKPAVKAKAKPKPKPCKKGFVKKHARCVKKKAKRSSTHSKKGRK